jgi:hypothetical protein
MNYSGAAPRIPEGGKFGVGFPGAPDTVRWHTGQSGICVGQFNHQNQLGKGVSLFPFHVRNESESEREGKTNQPRNKADEHGDLFYRGSVLKNLVPVEVVTKTGSLSTLSLSQTVT